MAADHPAGVPRWQARAGEVTSHCCYADSGGRPVKWFRVIAQYAYLRGVPKVESPLAGICQEGCLIQTYESVVKDEEGHVWVEFTPLSQWRLNVDTEKFPRTMTLLDGTDWGFGLLLEELRADRWPPPDAAESAGIRWQVLEEHAFRPRDARGLPPARRKPERYLCRWDPEPVPFVPGARRRAAGAAVAACCMLSGALLPSVESWLRYHAHIGLHALYLFFDSPEDQAIPVARRVAASLRSCIVCIHECSEHWWAQQKTRSRFYRYRHLKWAAPVVETHEGLRDVQCRQQLCVDLAIQDAFRDGVDWLVHIDIDELLYFPHEKYREDASGWFGKVDPDVDIIKFHNHECVPEEMEVDDWFRDITLFKPAITFLVQPDDPHQIPEVTPPQSEDDKADSGSDKTDDEEEPQEKLKINEVDNVLTTIAFARTRHMKTLGLNLPEQPWLRKRRLRLERRQKRREARGLKCDPAEKNRLPETFTHFIAYANGKCAVRIQSAGTRAMMALCQPGPAQGVEVDVRVIDSLPLPNGVHSFMTGVINNDRGRIRQLRRQRQDGLEDPVVLHYANSGFSYWVRKYEMLGKFPDVVNGKQNTMRAHLAARDVICGSRSLEQLELFYRLFVMCNVIGELPLLFNRGLVIRIDGARQIVERSRRAAPA